MMRPLSEQDEFLLSRLIDDDLSAEEADSLRRRMENEPELRRVYACMTRLDSMLVARQSDQPSVDWTQFHSQVMAKCAGESREQQPVVFKFNKYLRVAMPFAAAAAIALVVWMYPQGSSPTQLLNPPVGPVANLGTKHLEQPIVSDSDTRILVEYVRHSVETADSDIQVSYARSDDLQKEIKDLDDHARSQEPHGAIMASVDEKPKSAPKAAVVAAASLMF